MDTNDRIYQYLIKVISEKAECSPDEIEPNTDFQTELYIDSLLSLEIIVNIQKHFNIRIDQDLLGSINTMNDLYPLVKERILINEEA
jgi:acyl carrier protein